MDNENQELEDFLERGGLNANELTRRRIVNIMTFVAMLIFWAIIALALQK